MALNATLFPSGLNNGTLGVNDVPGAIVRQPIGNVPTQIDWRTGLTAAITKPGDASGAYDPRNFVGKLERDTSVQHSLTLRQSSRGWLQGLHQYTPVFILKREDDPQHQAQTLSLPQINWWLQAGQITDDEYWKMYVGGAAQPRNNLRHSASAALMEAPLDAGNGLAKRAAFLAQATGVDGVETEFHTYTQLWGGHLSAFAPMLGIVNHVVGVAGGSGRSVPPRCSFYAAGMAQVAHMWGTNIVGSMLYFAIVPFPRVPSDNMDLIGVGGIDDHSKIAYDDKDLKHGFTEPMLEKHPFIKLPAWRNPLWTPDQPPTPGKPNRPVLFLENHRVLVEQAVLARVRDAKAGLAGPADSREEILDCFYDTIALEFVGTIIQPPSIAPSSLDLERAPFDARALCRLPTSRVSLEVTQCV